VGYNLSMCVIYLAGGHRHNKDWIERIKKRFDNFSNGQILYYDHWKSGKKMIDWKKELKKLTELIEDKEDYFVFAKSMGTVLSLKAINDGVFSPKKAIFCGLPYGLSKKKGAEKVLAELSVPTIFVQNEFDPVCGYEKLKQILEKNEPEDYRLVKNRGNHTHGYEDYEQLTSLAKEFFVD